MAAQTPLFHRVLITGARGLVGTPTASAFSALPGIHVTTCGHSDLDITDEGAVQTIARSFRPDLVVNCAAFTKVDDCESRADYAMKVNGTGAGVVARAAASIEARFIHLSTDYVFAGDAQEPYTEDHPTAPAERLSAYGRSKLAGEREVTRNHPGALIVRTAWVYGPDGPGFPNAILKAATDRPRLKVVNDQTGSPTYAPDLGQAVVSLAQLGSTGIMHVTNSGICTWYEFAREILGLAGLSTPVEPCTTAEFPRPARRPSYSVLDNRRYIAATGQPLRPWKEALAEFLSSRGRHP